MLPTEKFRLRVTWGGRTEYPDAIATRLTATLAALEAFGGELGRHFTEVTSHADVTADPGILLGLIKAGFEYDHESRENIWANGSSTSYVQDPSTPRPRPHIAMRVRAGGERRSLRSVPNSVNLLFNGARGGTGAAYPVADEVLPRLGELFEALITTWDPDAITFDSATLWDFAADPSVDPDVAPEMPAVGYLTWLSDAVTPGIDDVPGASTTRIADGTLISVDLDADDIVSRAEGVAMHLHRGGYVLPLPLTQGDAVR